MKNYVRNGSGAEAGHPQKSTFCFYLRMQFLYKAVQEMPTSSLSRNICHDEASALSSNDSEFQQYNVSSPTDCSTFMKHQTIRLIADD